jgi:hypothetical protein
VKGHLRPAEDLLIDNTLMLPAVDLGLVADLADVGHVREQPVETTLDERASATADLLSGGPAFRGPPAAVPLSDRGDQPINFSEAATTAPAIGLPGL